MSGSVAAFPTLFPRVNVRVATPKHARALPGFTLFVHPFSNGHDLPSRCCNSVINARSGTVESKGPTPAFFRITPAVLALLEATTLHGFWAWGFQPPAPLPLCGSWPVVHGGFRVEVWV